MSWKNARFAASKLLKDAKSEASGTPDAIQKSYNKVERALPHNERRPRDYQRKRK